jgi:hypothetical protein
LNHAEAALTQAVELNGDDQLAQFNLGLLKESQGKLKEAGQHFEKAAGVAGAAEKIKALKQFTANNSILAAAPIGLNTHIQSVISDGTDSDFFKFNAPPVPRDILKVSLKNLSTSLDPSIHLYDSTKQQISAAGDFGRPGNGADLELAFSDSPGAVFYLQVSSQDGTTGAYSVTVKPEKAFDRYEPNDDILHPAPIKVNEKIEANIMDGNDVDFYTFQALPRGGNVSVQLDNESTTLNPQITLYDSNKEQINSAGSFGRPGSGANLGLQFATDPGAVYFVSISPQDSSAGAYSMTVKE